MMGRSHFSQFLAEGWEKGYLFYLSGIFFVI